MPGHMNVLLAEADVPYESLDDLDDANAKFPSADVALVVGANDVVNPAARDDPSSPLYGMPILNADQAAHVVFMKRSMRPGFSGVDNALLYDPRTVLLFGDAKDSLSKLVSAVRAA
jgi:NAD(P) transhydrogenase subunit beta